MGHIRHARHWIIAAFHNPDWVSAITAVGALFAAIIAAIYARRMWIIERARDDRRDESELRSQASKVICMASSGTEPVYINYDDPYDNTSAGDIDVPTVRILNRSDLPVYDVVLTHPVKSDATIDLTAEPGDPGDPVDRNYKESFVPLEGEISIDLGRNDVLEGLSERGIVVEDIDLELFEDMYRVCAQWKKHGRPSIEFTDAAGNRWQRDGTGALQLIYRPQSRKRARGRKSA